MDNTQADQPASSLPNLVESSFLASALDQGVPLTLDEARMMAKISDFRELHLLPPDLQERVKKIPTALSLWHPEA